MRPESVPAVRTAIARWPWFLCPRCSESRSCRRALARSIGRCSAPGRCRRAGSRDARFVATIKPLEDVRQVVRRNAHTGIVNRDDRLAPFTIVRQVDRDRPPGCVNLTALSIKLLTTCCSAARCRGPAMARTCRIANRRPVPRRRRRHVDRMLRQSIERNRLGIDLHAAGVAFGQ